MRTNLIPSHPNPDSENPQEPCSKRMVAIYWRSPLLYMRNNRLRNCLFIFFSNVCKRKEVVRMEKQMFHLEYHNQAWLVLSKSPSDVVLN